MPSLLKNEKISTVFNSYEQQHSWVGILTSEMMKPAQRGGDVLVVTQRLGGSSGTGDNQVTFPQSQLPPRYLDIYCQTIEHLFLELEKQLKFSLRK